MAVRVFTRSILGVLGLSVLLAWLAVRAGSQRDFWILYGAASLAPLLAVGLFRPAAAALWPRTAVLYYATAVIDRLRNWSATPEEGLRYLQRVVPPLESTLLGPAFEVRLAGSRWARTRLRERLEAVTCELGEAELRLLATSGQDAQEIADRLRDKLGVLLLAVSYRRCAWLPEPAGADPVAPPPHDAAGSWGGKVVEAVTGKALDWSVTALTSALIAVLVPVLHA
jgi:hypothetical protein